MVDVPPGFTFLSIAVIGALPVYELFKPLFLHFARRINPAADALWLIDRTGDLDELPASRVSSLLHLSAL